MIKITNVNKRFGATIALASVSAEFRRGEVHCLLGENGAGKSTIGKMLGGLHQPDEGLMVIDGVAQTLANPKAAHRLGIAICHQELSLAKHLSARANLCLGTERIRHPFSRVGSEREKQRAGAVLKKLGLDIDMERPVGELPVAQQQLIEIGKALMQEPKAIVFDEPTAMLGAVEKKKFLAVLRQLRDEGVAAILITHHIEDVMAVSDHITIMRNGKVVDSFAMGPDITSDIVVERLTGKKREKLVHARSQRAHGETVLEIQGMDATAQSDNKLGLLRGQIVALYGVVGCGAEKIVAGLTGQGSAGAFSFRLRGRPYRPANATQALRNGVAYLPSGRAANCIFPTRSIAENLTLSLLGRFAPMGFVSATQEKEYALGTLRDAGVKFTDASLPITSLSGGNQQKVLLARAMASARDLLILEEPSAGVDIDAKAQIHARISAAAANGMTVLMVSSDLEETLALSDVVLTMYASEVVNAYESPTAADQADIIADVLGQRGAGSPLQ